MAEYADLIHRCLPGAWAQKDQQPVQPDGRAEKACTLQVRESCHCCGATIGYCSGHAGPACAELRSDLYFAVITIKHPKSGYCRPEWETLRQRAGESEDAYRARMLGLGLHFTQKAQPAAAQSMEEAPMLSSSLPAATAAAAAGAAPGALPGSLEALAEKGQAPGVPTAPTPGWFAVCCLARCVAYFLC